MIGQTFASVFWLSSAWTLNRLFHALFWEPMGSRPGGQGAPRLLVDLSALSVYGLAVTIIVGVVFGQSLTGVWATSGVVGLVLGLAVRNLILDLFTGIAVNVEQPFRTGDWVEAEIPGTTKVGRIVEMNWRTTRLAAEDGDVVVIPNGMLATLVVTRLGGVAGRMRQEERVVLDFTVPVARARRILLAAAVEVSETPGFATDIPPVVLVGGIDDHGVEYFLRYWITVWKELSPSTARGLVCAAIVEHLRQAGLAPAQLKENIYIGRLSKQTLDREHESERTELLSRVDLFSSLDAAELENLASSLRRTGVRRGDDLLRAGDPGDSMFIVSQGVLDVLIPSECAGDPQKISRIGPGQVLGEMSLLTGEPRSATLLAVTDVVAYEITREPLAMLFEKRPEVAAEISEVVARRLSAQRDVLASRSADPEMDREVMAGQLLRRIRSVFRSGRS